MTTDGIHYLKSRLNSIPTTPGVYRMLSAGGEVLYVGKAKNLKARLTSYTNGDQLSTRIRKMVFETCELIVVETASEAEALLLEAELIKSLKPKYNIIMRDDSSYPLILITDEDTPQVRYHRGARKYAGEYFGPYPGAGAVHHTLEVMEKAFRLRTCKDSVFNNRTRPCLKYDIKRCSGPCVGKISLDDYAELVHEAKLFLRGKSDQVQKHLKQRMEQAANDQRYEDAANERDRLQALMAVTAQAQSSIHALAEADIFAIASQAGQCCIQGFFYRGGRHVGNHAFFPKIDDEDSLGEILRQFIAQHYSANTAPPLVLTSHKVSDELELMDALSIHAKRRIAINAPQKGEKRQVIEQALHNAASQLARRLAQQQNWHEQMQEFAKILKREEPIERVECFDISNISGKQPVASLVVAGGEGMLKNEYRKFKINVKDTPDDYSMMYEALSRRYGRLLKDGAKFPSVIMVDGGKGHLNVLTKVFDDLAIDADSLGVSLCSIAKGEERDKGLERIFLAGEEHPLPIYYNTPLIFILQQIRDESHRFAITFHRQQRGKGTSKSALDNIPGVGPKRKKALLLAFGSVANIRSQNIKALSNVDGVSYELAQTIYDYLR